MATPARLILIAALMLTSTAPAQAFGWGPFYTSGYRSTSYSPAYYACYVPVVYSYPAYGYVATPIYMMPAVTVVPGVAPVVQPVPKYAQPSPAPSSQTAPPPAAPAKPTGPKVSESQSFSGPPTAAAASAGGQVQVGFWNTRARDVALSVNGQPYTLAAGHAVTLNLPRQFAWRMDQGDNRTESVPADRANFEIVIR